MILCSCVFTYDVMMCGFLVIAPDGSVVSITFTMDLRLLRS